MEALKTMATGCHRGRRIWPDPSRESILDLPKYGCVNVHASLLPKYRGAAPIQWAVIDGEEESGSYDHDDGCGTGYRRYAGTES
ncbi:MAG: formyltransferase family protein [Pilosibacter sp.]